MMHEDRGSMMENRVLKIAIFYPQFSILGVFR